MLNILEDIDEEKYFLEEEKDRISAILESIGDGVFVVDRSLRIIMFNHIAENLSGYNAKEAIGNDYRNILNFVFKNSEKDYDFIRSAIKEGEIKEMARHTILIRKNGEKIPVADSAAPVKNSKGEVIGCVVVFRVIGFTYLANQMATIHFDHYTSISDHRRKCNYQRLELD